MYESYFGFREMPFSVLPDPRFFYSNDGYEVTFSALRYGIIWRKGVILVIGEFGTGKTTLLRKLMYEIEATVQTSYVSYANFGINELVRRSMHDLGIAAKGTGRVEMFREFNKYLVHQFNNGRTAALLIDEAQNLSDESLEGLGLLSNLEVNNEKVLQIVLVGQPELNEKLNDPSIRQLNDHIAIRCGLNSLADAEIGSYIRHRLRVAGYNGPEVFSSQAVESITTYSRGRPRLINTLCDNALILAFRASSRKVSADMIRDVAGNLGLEANFKTAETNVRPSNQTASSRWNDTGEKGVKRENPVDKAEGLPHDTQGSASQPAQSSVDLRQHTISPEFFQTMSRALARAMGPMASPVLSDQISALGESRDAFPVAKVGQLVDAVSQSILNEALKADFQNFIRQEVYRHKRLAANEK